MAATQRLSSVLAHITPLSSESTGRAKLLQKNADDIVRPFLSQDRQLQLNSGQVITYAARTPLTKAKKGALKDTPIDDLLIALLSVCSLPSLVRTLALPKLTLSDRPRAIQPRPFPC
jgi:acetyl-CoA acyltransferase 1